MGKRNLDDPSNWLLEDGPRSYALLCGYLKELEVQQEAKQQAFLVNLVDCAASAEGQLKVKLATLGGGEMEFELAGDSLVRALLVLVKKESHLGANTVVKVIAADERVLDPGSELQLATTDVI